MNFNKWLNDFKLMMITSWNKGIIQKKARITSKVIMRVILFFIILGAISIVTVLGIGVGYFTSLIKDEPIRSYAEMERDIYNYEETSEIYFADNKYIGEIQADLQREEVLLENVSKNIIEAVLATEDQEFYEHNGIVPKAIARAILQEVSNSDTKSGGSTLTQQLIKNQILTNEVSFDRKAKEIVLAMRLENHFEKDQILEAYLNVIPYGREASGRNIAGIQTASKGIFGINANEVNIAQAAYLAGLPQNPYTFTPFTNAGELKEKEAIELGINRMKTVLKRMQDSGYINQKEYDSALSYDITKDFTKKKASPREKYPILVFEIEKRAKEVLVKEKSLLDGYTLEDLEADEELNEQYNILAERALRMEGYQVHTTIDKDLYESMQKVASDYQYYGPDRTFTEQDSKTGESVTKTEPVQAGAVLIENSSGKILSFIGNRNASVEEHYNFSMNARRSPGSTIKPLVVYGPGLDLGIIQPGTVLPDIPDRPGWSPKNYGNFYYGLVSARQALTNSYNVSTVEAYNKIINRNPAKNYLAKMGVNVSTEDETNPSLSIGTNDMSVEENTSAFTTFANEGKYLDSYMIDKITDKEGKIIYQHKANPVDVLSPQAAYLTLDMMRDVVTQGTGTYAMSQLNTYGTDWAAKTGTSQDYHDIWYVGTNPNVTIGTWIGYETPSSVWCTNCSLGHDQRNQKLWANLVNKATELKPELMAPQKRFKQPEGLVYRNYCATSGLVPSKLCQAAGLVKTDLYDARYTPSQIDDSLVGSTGSSKLVKMQGKEVVASSKTPSEFTYNGKSTGYAFNPEFLQRMGYNRLGDLSLLFPRNHSEAWDKISVSGSGNSSRTSVNNDGKAPAAPSDLRNSSTSLSWSASGSHDVIGYRIYKSGSKIGSTTSTSFSIPSSKGVYTVKAVDYFGMESAPSNSLEVSKTSEKDDDKKKDDNKDEKEQEEKEKKEKEEKEKAEKDKEKAEKEKEEKEEKEKKDKEEIAKKEKEEKEKD